MNNEKIDKIIPTDELDNVLPKYEPLKLSGKNLAQQYVSAFNTGMNIYQCVNYLQGSIDATINGVNNVVKSWNDSVDETLTKSIEITKETTTEQFNKEWTNKQPELIEKVNTLTTNQFNEDWGVLENRINTTLEAQNTNIQNIQTQQTNLSNQQTTLSNRMDTFTSLSEGSTTGDAELQDIRVGANGTTYDTAGNAVRGQYSQLKEDLAKLFVDNNTPSLTIEENKYIDYNNGRATSHTSGSPKSVSGIVVPCNSAIKIVLKYVPFGGDRGFAFYDENNKFLKGYGYTPNVLEYSVVTPIKARYLAITSFDYDYKVIQFDGNSLSNTLSSILDNDYESEQLNKYFDIDNNELYDSTYYAIRKLYVLEGETLKINTHGFTHNSVGIGFFCSRGMGLISKHRITESIFELTVPNRANYVLISYRQELGIDIEIDVKKQAFIKNPYQNYPLSKLDMSPTFITMFRKIVCIGDSLTQGEFDVTSGSNKFPQFSWVAQMGKMTGVPCVNLGIGSHSASRSATYPWLKTALQESGAIASPFETTDFTENPADAYIIALGTNDIGDLGSFTGDLSTDINDADYLQNAHTSVGGYAEIIQRIIEMQPKAKIFCVTIPQTRNNATTRLEANTKIKSIASKFGCYIIDLETYGEGEKGDYKDFYKNSSHSNALGHNLRAREYIAYIDWIVENNLDDFRNVQFIGSNSDWVKS